MYTPLNPPTLGGDSYKINEKFRISHIMSVLWEVFGYHGYNNYTVIIKFLHKKFAFT